MEASLYVVDESLFEEVLERGGVALWDDQERERFRFLKADLADQTAIEATFAEEKPQRVIHLAAQAGVRYSLDHPHAYISSNIAGFLHILEGCRHHGVEHLVYASSSSVYGANRKLPFDVGDPVDHPVSLYGATKKANELMAHSYAHMFRLPVSGLRFFTVYGPWGRPDMSLFVFTRKLLAGEPIQVFNFGHHARDFTYIDDAVEGVVRVLDAVSWNKKEAARVLEISRGTLYRKIVEYNLEPETRTSRNKTPE